MNDYASVFSDFRPVNRLDILEVRTVYNEEQICSRPLVLFITGFDRLSGSLHLAFIPAIIRNLAFLSLNVLLHLFLAILRHKGPAPGLDLGCDPDAVAAEIEFCVRTRKLTVIAEPL